VVDRDSYNFTFTGKRTDVYNQLHAVEFFLRHSDWFSFVKTLFVAYDTRIFQHPVQNTKSPVATPSQSNPVQNINTKTRAGEIHM